MTALIAANPNLPEYIRNAIATLDATALTEMSGGVNAGFPIVSYKGKVWRIREGGEEQMHLDQNGNAAPTVDVVLVQGNPNLSKIFYDKQYEDGLNEAPRCFSNDGITPDASVVNPINAACATCPNNAWGSKITPNGKKTRACSDARRMAVVFAQDLNENLDNAKLHLLRVPPASLAPLKDYSEKTLAARGIPFFALVTRIGFDPHEAHPQFMFKAARFLDEEEFATITKMRGNPDVLRILAETQEFGAGGAANGQDAGSAPTAAPAAAPSQPAASTTPPAAGRRAAPRPATEEEAAMGLAPAAPPAPPAEDAIAPAPTRRKRKPATAAAAAPAAVAEEEAEEPAPAPPPARRAAPAAAAPAAAPAAAAVDAAASKSLESLLDDLLG